MTEERQTLLEAASHAQEQLDWWKSERDSVIRAAAEAGCKYRELSEATGLGQGTLSTIINYANGRVTPTATEKKEAGS